MRWLLKVSAEKRKSSTGSGAIAPPPRHVVGRGLAARSLVALARPDLLAEDGAALLLDGQAVAGEDALDHGGEHQGPGAAGLDRDVGQLGLAANRLADAERPVEAEALAREHAAGQRHRRDHPGVERAAVGPERRRRKARQEVERTASPGGSGSPGPSSGSSRPKVRRSRLAGAAVTTSVGALAPADVRLQVVERGARCSDGRHARTGGRRRCQSVARW